MPNRKLKTAAPTRRTTAPQPLQSSATRNPTRPASDLLVVPLDDEASRVVNDWSTILSREPRDVASALVAHVHKESLERYIVHRDEDRLQSMPEDAECIIEAITEAARRRKSALERQYATPPFGAEEVALALPPRISKSLRDFADSGRSFAPADLAEAMVQHLVSECERDPCLLLSFAADATDLYLARAR